MKKHSLIFLLTLLFLGASCSQNTPPTTNTNTIQQTVTDNKQEIDLEKIMENVKNNFSTVKEVKIYTEENDPNNHLLGKAGYYMAGAAFWDTRTEYTEEYSEEKGKWGVQAGGSIEVYANSEDAKKRADYLQGLVGTPITDPGAFKQMDTVIIRAAYELKKSEQDEIIQFLETQVQQYNK